MRFEDLIKSLRIHGDPTSSCEGCIMHKLDVRKCGKALCNEAADAIEELIEVIQNHDFLESLIKSKDSESPKEE